MSIKSILRKHIFTSSKSQLRTQALEHLAKVKADHKEKVASKVEPAVEPTPAPVAITTRTLDEAIQQKYAEFANAEKKAPVDVTPAVASAVALSTPTDDFASKLQGARDMIAKQKQKEASITTNTIGERLTLTPTADMKSTEFKTSSGVSWFVVEPVRPDPAIKEYLRSDATGISYHLPSAGYSLLSDQNKDKSLFRAFIKKDQKSKEWEVWDELLTQSGEQLTATEFKSILAGKPTYDQLKQGYDPITLQFYRKVTPSSEVVVW